MARRLTITSCCGESFCHGCIVPLQQEAKACPVCLEESFSIYEQVKYQKRLSSIQVYCTMRDRGCEWSGTLDQLDSHLDPNQNQCQYIDIDCPLNCKQAVPKNRLEVHVRDACLKRDYICQHCAYKSSYEEVVSRHTAECIYLPLKCHNNCGVTCERQFMEDHLAMCRLEEICCEFGDFGCDQKFPREEEDEHSKLNIQKHLSLLHAGSVKKTEELVSRIQQRDCIIDEQKKAIEELKSKLYQQEHKIEKQEQKFMELFSGQKSVTASLQQRLKQNEATASIINVLNRSFVIENFSKEKTRNKSSEWKTPPMYTHLYGYKFCIGIDANGDGESLGKAMRMELWPLKGPNDYRLKWPASARFTIKLVNEMKVKTLHYTARKTWLRPDNDSTFCNFERIKCGSSYAFILHSDLNRYLCDDSLYFSVSEISVE